VSVDAIARERTQTVDAMRTRVRAIVSQAGVTATSLDRIKDELGALAAQRHLFPDAHFPGPGADRQATLYRVAEDPDGGYALYVYRPKPGKETPAHNHTTWAVIAGIEGEEPTRQYVRVGEGASAALKLTREFAVGPGEVAGYLPDDFHSIHIKGEKPIFHLHLYGRRLEDLTGREAWDPALGKFVNAYQRSEILTPLAG
jgi:predicted metal-dependent enzyme (double-stranded beta helix superfamily)